MQKIDLPMLPARKSDSHKGNYGKVLIIGGSETMPAAPAISGLAACRTGAGLCRIATVKEALPIALMLCPSATGFVLSSRDTKALLDFADEHDALAVGPGLGQSPLAKKIVLELLARHSGPMVLDADALNILSGLEASEWPKRKNWSNVVLTPHTVEFMRLMGAVTKRRGSLEIASHPVPESPSEQNSGVPASDATPEDSENTAEAYCTADGVAIDFEPEPPPAAVAGPVNTGDNAATAPDRWALAEILSRATGCVVALKGHRTAVADGGRGAINQTGNPAMATAGMGDVLTGVIAALIGQGIAPAEAAVLGVHIHGLAGDMAVQTIGPAGLLAMDVANLLPRALATRLADS